MRRRRERDLRCGARTLALGNLEIVGLFAGSPRERERLLVHAAAHNADRGRPAHERIPMAALHDYLAETMGHLGGQVVAGTAHR